MANRKISELIEATSISGTDVLPIVNGGYTQKVKVDTLAEVTNEYTRANFLSLSGGTVTTGLSVNEIFEVGTGLTVLFVSGSRVGINTKTPNEALTVYGNISAVVINSTDGNSNDWGSVYSSVADTSANWDSVYSNVKANSASYATIDFANNKFFALTGGRIDGNVTIFGNLTSTGTQTFANTIFSTTSSLSVVHVGSGPAIWVGNNGTGDIASFNDMDQGIEVLHVGGVNSTYPNVGVKTSTPNKTFTVNGEISASNIIYDNEGNSSQWNFAYSNQINFLPLSGGSMTGSLTVVGNISATQNYFSGNNKSVLTPQTNTTGTSAIGNIVAVSALPVSPDPSTLYIIV